MKTPHFPSWQDVGLPNTVPDSLRKIRYGGLLNFLLSYRVFLQESEVKYIYLCGVCSYQKTNVTPFESYSECKRCASNDVHAIPYLTLNRGNSKPFNKNLVSL